MEKTSRKNTLGAEHSIAIGVLRYASDCGVVSPFFRQDLMKQAVQKKQKEGVERRCRRCPRLHDGMRSGAEARSSCSGGGFRRDLPWAARYRWPLSRDAALNSAEYI